MPFDLDGYSPDLIAVKGEQHLIIEVKPQTARLSFDTLRSVSSQVRRHQGWRFLLVTGQDVDEGTLPGQAEESFSWDDALKRATRPKGRRCRVPQSWHSFDCGSQLERMMRFRSRQIALPVDRLVSPAIMIGPLYSHGELSAHQFKVAADLVKVRNQVIHGLDVPNLVEHLESLAQSVREIREDWSGPASEDDAAL